MLLKVFRNYDEDRNDNDEKDDTKADRSVENEDMDKDSVDEEDDKEEDAKADTVGWNDWNRLRAPSVKIVVAIMVPLDAWNLLLIKDVWPWPVDELFKRNWNSTTTMYFPVQHLTQTGVLYHCNIVGL